jgi:hypothetical protein
LSAYLVHAGSVAFDTVQPWKEQVATGLIFIQTRSLGHDQDTRATAAQGTWPAGLRTLCVQVGSFLTHYCNNLLAHEFIIQVHEKHEAGSESNAGSFCACNLKPNGIPTPPTLQAHTLSWPQPERTRRRAPLQPNTEYRIQNTELRAANELLAKIRPFWYHHCSIVVRGKRIAEGFQPLA